MISFPTSVRIVVAMRPVDFRRGGESLAALAREVLNENPYKGVIVIFRSRRADRIKIVTWDQTGLVMLWKALDGAKFQWPPVVDGCMQLCEIRRSPATYSENSPAGASDHCPATGSDN